MIISNRYRYLVFEKCPHCGSHYRSRLQPGRCDGCGGIWKEPLIEGRLIVLVLVVVIAWALVVKYFNGGMG